MAALDEIGPDAQSTPYVRERNSSNGCRIRFIGDCIHGLLCEGTALTTDVEETISTGTLCASALRSSFDLALEKLAEDGVDTEGLGLAIGFEYGFMAVSRLGLKGDRVRCAVSRGVLTSEGTNAVHWRANGHRKVGV